MERDYFVELCAKFSAQPDRRGEVYITCPFCGKESSRKKAHGSFSRKGFKCFTCGEGCGLKKLAEMVGARQVQYVVREQKRNERPPEWLSRPETYVDRYENHPRRMELWAGYKPLPEQVIISKRLGVGVLPSSRCQHERLVVPVMVGTRIVGLRGRSLGCDCGKWLASGGTKIDSLPLYNSEAVTAGSVVMVVENPVDALMVTAMTEYVGVATYSVAYWKDEWADTLRLAQLVVVAYDNDLPGNGGGARRELLIREWMKTHPIVPEPAGPKLANRLLEAGIDAALFPWVGDTKDIGQMLAVVQTREVI